MTCTVSAQPATSSGATLTSFVDGEVATLKLSETAASRQTLEVPSRGGVHELAAQIQDADGGVVAESSYFFRLGGAWMTTALVPSLADGSAQTLNPSLLVAPENDEFTEDTMIKYTVRQGSSTGPVVAESDWTNSAYDIASGVLEPGQRLSWSAEISGTPTGSSAPTTRISENWSFTTEESVGVTVLGSVPTDTTLTSSHLTSQGVSQAALQAAQIESETGTPAYDPALPITAPSEEEGSFSTMEALPSDIMSSWVSADARTVYLRRGVLQKVVNKHAIDAAVVRVVTQKSTNTQRDTSPTVRIHNLTAADVTCYVWGCRVKQSTNVKAVVEYRKYLGKTYGVVTTYCPGTTKCPSYVKNALNK